MNQQHQAEIQAKQYNKKKTWQRPILAPVKTQKLRSPNTIGGSSHIISINPCHHCLRPDKAVLGHGSLNAISLLMVICSDCHTVLKWYFVQNHKIGKNWFDGLCFSINNCFAKQHFFSNCITFNKSCKAYQILNGMSSINKIFLQVSFFEIANSFYQLFQSWSINTFIKCNSKFRMP